MLLYNIVIEFSKVLNRPLMHIVIIYNSHTFTGRTLCIELTYNISLLAVYISLIRYHYILPILYLSYSSIKQPSTRPHSAMAKK